MADKEDPKKMQPSNKSDAPKEEKQKKPARMVLLDKIQKLPKRVSDEVKDRLCADCVNAESAGDLKVVEKEYEKHAKTPKKEG